MDIELLEYCMDFTFVILALSIGLFIGSYFFYCQIDEKFDDIVHNIDADFTDLKQLVIEDHERIKESLKDFLEKHRVEINKIKDELDALKEQPKESHKTLRKLPLKSNEKASDEEKS